MGSKKKRLHSKPVQSSEPKWSKKNSCITFNRDDLSKWYSACSARYYDDELEDIIELVWNDTITSNAENDTGEKDEERSKGEIEKTVIRISAKSTEWLNMTAPIKYKELQHMFTITLFFKTTSWYRALLTTCGFNTNT